MVQKKLFLILALIGAASAEANVLARSFVVKFKNAAESSEVTLNSTATSKAGEALKVAAFSDLKGAVITISNSAVYDEELKKFTNTFTVLKKDASAADAAVLAELSATCVVRNELSCRALVESDALIVEVESALSSELGEEYKSVDLVIAAHKALSNDGTGFEKTLEDLQTIIRVKSATETLVYSDTQSKSSLSAKAEVDQYSNVGLTFKGKDGFIFLSSRNGQRVRFDLEAPAPIAGLQFKRALEVEAVAGNPMGAAVQMQSANVQAKLEQTVGDEYRGLPFDTSLGFDETSLKPDPSQTGYSVGNGLLVLKEEQNLENSVALETYWDIEPVEAADAQKNMVRTQVYKVKTASSERVIKIRSNSGQRVSLVLADTPDPTKKDLSHLELEFVLGAGAAGQPVNGDDPFDNRPANPARFDPFQQ